VFPLLPRSKDPYTKEFPFDSARPYGPPHGVTHATREAFQVRQWWTARPDSNVGITGDTILDIDTGLSSLADLEAFEQMHNLPPSLAIRTGGRPGYRVQLHYTGIMPNHTYNTGAVSGEVRSWHEYGLGAESVHPTSGEKYLLVRDLSRAPCPVDLMKAFWKERASSRGTGEEYEAVSIQDARDIYSRLLSRARHAVKGGRNRNANTLARFGARGMLAGIFKEFALFNGEVVLHAMTEKEIWVQISEAIEPLYRGDRRDWLAMLRYSWKSGLRAGPLALTITHDDYIKIELLTDDARFQLAWDGDLSEFDGNAIAARGYLARSLIEVGIADVQRVLNSSKIMEVVANQFLFELRIAQIEGEK
jgi:hypothetical protein